MYLHVLCGYVYEHVYIYLKEYDVIKAKQTF